MKGRFGKLFTVLSNGERINRSSLPVLNCNGEESSRYVKNVSTWIGVVRFDSMPDSAGPTKGDSITGRYESIRTTRHPNTQQSEQMHAKAKITVQTSDAKPYDQTAGPALVEIHLSETFAGDLNGESLVRALEVLRDDHSSRLVSMQRFHGNLDGRQGTFVFQGSETVENGNIKATWFVVPGSGTGELSGLRGEGGFEGHFGRGSDGTLDYWFE